ncbi:hypothetical protein [Pseudoxanthomonas sp.]|uniref:hypothetical protein n=1 Tax=Pseudoxanthomonas sp. TaxID=1871049 RepID=UPI00258C9385|nr:hypothetical protein [Pseudoxanthomonas sp.]MCR6686070.1 hypothetical protein [Pseudoxanthomonas sp.]
MPNSLVVVHIAAGSVALAAGAVALYSLKGAKLHRKSGMLFVFVMLVMSATGAVMAALKPEAISVIAGALTFYLVITALLTVRRPAASARWIDFCAMFVALAIGISGIYFGLEALNSSTGTKDGFPAPPYFIFGSVALLASLLDLRMLLARGIKGPHRLARHLWRMCFALLIAAASFFLGQAQVFPESIPFVLLTIPVLLVLLLMLYWLARVFFTRRYGRA